ncbi:MAG: GHKL domain-containing protein [Burkholderiales bacterium]|jgi:nitrogen fixation/metabolism regulation signal transduction histidine kinase|nr:GHKL domain-containing protein [Burkholderiales bacterium]
MKRTNIGFLVVLFILIIFSYFYVTIYSKYDVMLYLNDYKEIIQLNRIIEVLLLITIAFFVYKIFFRSNYVFGSRITKKLFILLSSVIVIPSLINIKIANYFIDNTVNRLFNPQIEELFDNSFNIAEESIKYFSKELRKKSVIAAEYLKLVDKNDDKADLAKIRNILDVTSLTIYKQNGILELQDKQNDSKYFPSILPKYIIDKIKISGYYYEINKDNSGNYLFYYYQFYDDNKIIALTQFAPDFIRIDNSKLIQNKELYLGLLNNKDHLKDVYTSTLIISVLLSISIAVLLSMFFSQFLIKRISNLIENIELIKQGSYLNNNSFQGNDELSQLITSFNEMSHNLDRVRKLEKFQKDQITASKNFLENLINNLNLSVVVYDQDYIIKSINIISHSILDIDLETIKGTPLNQWGSLYPHLEDLINIIEINSKQNNEWEENVIVRNRHSIKNLYIKTIKFKTHENSQYMTLISDVTNLIKAKQNQAWADIAKRLAHEIKNPLTPIVLSAERIEMKLVPKLSNDDQVFLQRLVKQIIIQVEDLKDLVNKFRDFANINKPNLSKIEMVHFFNQFLTLYENINYIKFEVDIPENEILIMGDSSLLRQVFHNLLKNSIESIENIENKLIKVVLNIQNEYLGITIKDNGNGFENIIMENLFEPYRTTKGVKGSGLGMAIVKKIIDEHNGKIEVFNDNGANVVVKLPLISQNTVL